MYRSYKETRSSLDQTMATATPIGDEWTLTVPREWMMKMSGFTTDTGGSMMKIVYRHKDDWKELESGSEGRLRFLTCPRARRAEALEYLLENAYFQHDVTSGPPTMVFTTGVGSHQFANELNKTFNIKAENIAEFDCFVHAFVRLVKEIPYEHLTYPPCTAEEEQIRRVMEEMKALMAKANEGGMTSLKFNMGETDEKKEDVKMTGKMNPQDVFPCLLAMCGSGMAWMKVNEDATFQIIDGSNRGGRYFMATGALMIGATSYEELTSLAEKGNPNNVHYTNIDIVRESQDQSDEQKEAGGLYSLTSEKQDENYLYLMGKAMGKSRDDFSREDIAAAHLQAFTSDLCQGLELCMRGENIKHVFWCGSFIKAEIIRRYLTLEWRRRAMNVLMMTGKSSPSELHFLKHGPYLGALGCVINSVSQFLKPPSEAAAEKKAKESSEETKM